MAWLTLWIYGRGGRGDTQVSGWGWGFGGVPNGVTLDFGGVVSPPLVSPVMAASPPPPYGGTCWGNKEASLSRGRGDWGEGLINWGEGLMRGVPKILEGGWLPPSGLLFLQRKDS